MDNKVSFTVMSTGIKPDKKQNLLCSAPDRIQNDVDYALRSRTTPAEIDSGSPRGVVVALSIKNSSKTYSARLPLLKVTEAF